MLHYVQTLFFPAWGDLFLKRFYIFVCIDTLSLHLWGWVTWSKVLSGILTQNMPIIRTQQLSSSLCVTEEVQNHWIVVSEKHNTYQTYLSSTSVRNKLPIKYVCQKLNIHKRCLSQKPSLGNKFHQQLWQLQKEFSLATVPVCSKSLWESILCNLHDKKWG
jgi:hypothetical protein